MECMHGKRYAKLCFTDLSCEIGNGLLCYYLSILLHLYPNIPSISTVIVNYRQTGRIDTIDALGIKVEPSQTNPT